MAKKKVKPGNPFDLAMRVAKLEGKVSILTRLNSVELTVLVLILITLVVKSG